MRCVQEGLFIVYAIATAFFSCTRGCFLCFVALSLKSLVFLILVCCCFVTFAALFCGA
jgi:hypothetical protein